MHKTLLAILLAALGGLHVAAAWHDRDMTCDDAFITFRYAENLRDGHGMRWNPDSEPCEGYTNLSYVVSLAGLSALGVTPKHGALVLASLSVVGTLVLLFLATRRAGRWQALALTPAMLLFASTDLQVHMSRGLETCMFAFLAVCQMMVASRLCAPHPDSRHTAFLAALCGAALFLTRPDGVLLSTSCWLTVGWMVRRDRPRRARLFLAIGLWLAMGSLYALWKLHVFGYLLPNAFYMKSGDGRFAGVAEVLEFLASYGALSGSLLVALVLHSWTARAFAGGRSGSADATVVLCFCTTLPWLVYGAKIVHEIGFSHRFCWPIVPVMVLGASRGLASATGALAGTRFARLWPIGWLLLAAMSWQVGPTQLAVWRHLQEPRQADPYTSMFLRLGEAIHSTGCAEQLSLYCTHAGATPYAARAHHVDRAGLVDDGYCRRTPAEARARYEAGLKWDVISWHLYPASPAATSFDTDARASASRYLNVWCLGLDPDMDTGLRQSQANITLEQRKAEMFAFMTILRDWATLVGEMRTGLERWREFVYVWKASPRHDFLVEHLSSRVDIPAAMIDFDGWPR